jgi:hypothetical protein
MNPSSSQDPSSSNYTQKNAPRGRGQVFANQGTGDQNIHLRPDRRGGGDSKALLVTLVVDVVFFVYGSLSYTGRSTSSDTWHAVIFLVLLAVTVGMIRRWLRRRI